jgi:hypothetical protein
MNKKGVVRQSESKRIKSADKKKKRKHEEEFWEQSSS